MRTGDLELETADGVRRRVGDGSGPKLGVRLARPGGGAGTADRPGARTRRALHGRTLRRHRGSLYEVLELGAQESRGSNTCPGSRGSSGRVRLARPASAQRPPARAQQNIPATTTWTPALRPVPRRGPAIFLRLFRASRPDARRGAKRQEAAHRRQAAGRRGRERARHRLRLRRHGALLAGAPGRARRPASRCPRSSSPWRRRAPSEHLAGDVDFRLRTTATSKESSTASFGRHVRAVGLAHFDEYFQRGPAADRRRRDAAARHRPHFGLPGTNPWIPKYISRAATSRALRGARDRAARPFRHRHRDPAPALRRNAGRLARALQRQPQPRSPSSTTSASAACGNST